MNDCLTQQPEALTVAALYCFARFAEPAALRMSLDRVCREHADLADDAFVAEHLQRWLD